MDNGYTYVVHVGSEESKIQFKCVGLGMPDRQIDNSPHDVVINANEVVHWKGITHVSKEKMIECLPFAFAFSVAVFFFLQIVFALPIHIHIHISYYVFPRDFPIIAPA